MKITISNPDNEYRTFIDTDVSDVLITEAYIGPKFVSSDGEELNVSMRDSGFEIVYIDGDDVEHHYSLNDGFVRRTAIRGRKAADDNVVPFTRK